MNIVTLFNYDLKNLNNLIMLKMFVGGIEHACIKYPYKLWIITNQENEINQLFPQSCIQTLKLKKNNYDVPIHLPNIKNKLYNLCNLNFPFIYLDCDMYINSDLSFLWDRRNDKPLISTFHQKNIPEHTDIKSDFMNSGLQVVSDPKFLNYEKFYNFAVKKEFTFCSPGTDQALLDEYFKSENYDFTHTEIGCEWNSCAGYGVVNIDAEYNFDIIYKNDNEQYQVKINHYWDKFKPWLINCPIFKFYQTVFS